MPQDVKLSPDGRTFYVADMMLNGVWLIDARTLRVIRFAADRRRRARPVSEPRRAARSTSPTAARARSRVISFAHTAADRQVAPARRRLARHGRRLGRRPRAVAQRAATTARSTRSRTRTGRLLHRIPVGSGPHGLCVWPQPGRYSLGHTGILR